MNKDTLPSLNWIFPGFNRAWLAGQTRKPKCGENVNSEIQMAELTFCKFN